MKRTARMDPEVAGVRGLPSGAATGERNLRQPEPGGNPLSRAEEWLRAECPRHRWSGHSARDQLGSLDFPEEHE
jgi:hypothetical protein